MNLKQKWFAVILLCVLIFPVCMTGLDAGTVLAATVQEKISAASKEKQEALDKIKKAEKEKGDVVAQSEELNREIDIVQTEIYEIDTIIEEADTEIKSKEEEIAEYEKNIEEQDDAFKRVLRAMDETSALSYIELLLSSESFAEFMVNLETIHEITKHDMAAIDEMVELKNGVEAAKAVVETKKAEQEEARSIAADKENTLQDKLEQKEALSAALDADIEKYKKVYEAARAEEEKLKASVAAELSKSEKPTVQYTGDSGNSGSTASSGKTSGGKFCWPAPSYTRISSPYGYRIHPIYKTKKLHSGVDMAAPGGTNILAAEAGTVIRATWNGGYGNCVIIDHGNGVSTLYGHAKKLLVSKGQKVTRGQVIALVGTTGNSTGNHLHFEVLLNGKTTNPMAYLN